MQREVLARLWLHKVLADLAVMWRGRMDRGTQQTTTHTLILLYLSTFDQIAVKRQLTRRLGGYLSKVSFQNCLVF